MSKYILVLKMPTGRGFVLGTRKTEEGDGLVLIPVEDNLLMMKDIFGFNEIVDAQLWIRERVKEKKHLTEWFKYVSILHSDEAFIQKGI